MSASTTEPASSLGFALQEQVLLAPYTTFGIGGPARWFAAVRTESELEAACAWANEQAVPIFVLGGGSNVLVADTGFSGLVLHMAMRGVSEEDWGAVRLFRMAAGEDWDAFVTRAVEADCAGVECLAGIPGLVGGTPVQNVGAYGQEVAATIEWVRCFDRETMRFVRLEKAACRFRYRESRFNTPPDRGRFVVTEVSFALRPGGAPTLSYADLQRRFADRVEPPTLAEVAAAVRAIREEKGMVVASGPLRDPDTRSAGSFFKNPVVPTTLVERIEAQWAPVRVPSYPAPDADQGGPRRKLAAAWLVEQAGFARGFSLGGAAVSSRHTLALTNKSGSATAAEICALRDRIRAEVEARFGVVLEPEPVLLGAELS